MRRIRIIANTSLDGVVQAPGGPDEDRDGGFAHGGWSMPHFAPAMAEAIAATQGDRFDLLLGRRTYDTFAAFWPGVQDDPIADGLNGAIKHVATHRPESLEWGPAEALGADIAAQVHDLKAQDGPDLIVWGSTTLTPVLFEAGLVDELLLFVFPILLGGGKRLFSDHATPHELTLTESRSAPTGVLINAYRVSGALQPDRPAPYSKETSQ